LRSNRRSSAARKLSAVKRLVRHLLRSGALSVDPTAGLQAPRADRRLPNHLSVDDAFRLLDTPGANTPAGLRDRALLGLMGYTFARVSAVVTLRVEDYFQQGRRSWLRLHEKGGKRHEVPCHHSLDQYLDAWIAAAEIADDKKGPLFRSFKKGDKLTTKPMTRSDVLYMIDISQR